MARQSYRNSCSFISALVALASAPVLAADDPGLAPGESISERSLVSSSRYGLSPQGVLLIDDLPAGAEVRVVPPGARHTHHVVRLGGDIADGGGVAGDIVFDNPAYSNTPPPEVYLELPFASIEVADDVRTVAVGGCDMVAFQFQVAGGGDGTGPGFEVAYRAYTACPHGGGLPIPGTSGSLAVDHDGLHTITVDLTASPVTMPSLFWFGIQFDIAGPGWVLGTAATFGFTENRYDFQFTPCNARFAGSTLYAGYHFQMLCQEPFDREFQAYRNMDITAPQAPQAPGANNWWADDVQLIADDCVLSSLELGVIGSLNFIVTTELRTFCPPAFVIPGTQGSKQVVGNSSPQVVRFDYPGGVALPSPQDSFWLAFKFNTGAANIIVPGEATLGFTEDLFGIQEDGDCNIYWLGGNPYAGFALTVSCLGEPPLGACCPRTIGATCSQSLMFGCLGAPTTWIEGASCDPDPFDPPCGTFACCLPEPWPMGPPENLLPEACAAGGGVMDGTQFCDVGSQSCGWFACVEAAEGCCTGHESAGCATRTCCNTVCTIDEWCCTVEWDAVCAREARELCNWNCPSGQVQWVDPPSGVVDARQPHAVSDATDVQGIETIVVRAPAHAGGVCCWELFETAITTTRNALSHEVNLGDGMYSLGLNRPITPGAVTQLAYRRSLEPWPSATFTAHPANADGDEVASLADILSLIDHLNGVQILPWGLYSCDMDHSGACEPPDILRLIDLLNGAGAFAPWLDTPRPEPPPGP